MKMIGTLGLAGALALSMAPAVSAPSASHKTSAQQSGDVGFPIPAWTTQPGKHRTTVNVSYPSGDPPASWDGQPVAIQVRVDGAWETVGQAAQKPVAGEAASRTRVTYTLPTEGEVRIRARAHSTDGAITSRVRTLAVAPSTPDYDPTALRGSWYAWDPVIGKNTSRIGFACCKASTDSPSFLKLHNGRAGNTRRLDSHAQDLEFATDAPNVAIAEGMFFWDEGYYYRRVLRYNLRTGNSRPVAFKRNGKRVTVATDSSINANGKRITYASPAKGIVRNASKGWNVYVVRSGKKRSRHLGRGRASDIAAFGRYVVWRNHNGKIRRYDLRTDRKLAVTRRAGTTGAPEVSAGGRYVSFTRKRNGKRFVLFYDAKRGELRRIGEGVEPAISDNGRFVSYRGRDSGLYVWSREAGASEQIAVGHDGDASGARLHQPDISPTGRWVVAWTTSPWVAPDNGRGSANNEVVLFDRNAR